MIRTLDKFPPLLQVSLQSQGFKFIPWKYNQIVNEDMRDFRRGTMQGLIGFQGGEIIIVALINNRPGNGDFASTMSKFEEVAAQFELGVRIVEFWNEKLMAHFVQKRGYKMAAQDEVRWVAVSDKAQV